MSVYVIFFDSYQKYIPSRVNSTELLRNSGLLRSSNPNFAKFTGKHLHQSPFLNKVVLLKKRLWQRSFPVNFAKFLRTPFLPEPPCWLLL